MNRDQLIDRIAKYWNELPPSDRRSSFRLGNKPFIYSRWEDLLDAERQIIINAARIRGTWGKG
jgi:hypothetical protein